MQRLLSTCGGSLMIEICYFLLSKQFNERTLKTSRRAIAAYNFDLLMHISIGGRERLYTADLFTRPVAEAED